MNSRWTPRTGQLVRIVGDIGTPSQKRAVWLVEDITITSVVMHRMGSPDSIVKWRMEDIEPINPLKMLAEQAV